MIKIEKENIAVIVRVDNYNQDNVRKGIAKIFTLLQPSFLDDKIHEKTILLKPNVLAPSKLAYTNKTVVEEIALFLQQASARNILIGDSCMTKYLTKYAHEKSGYSELAKKFGHPMINFFDEPFISISHPSFEMEKVVRISKKIVEADVIINIPKLKTHIGYIYTGAIKNFFGILENKLQYHKVYKDKGEFQKMLGDIHQAVLSTGKHGKPKPVLHILDGIIAMVKKGPRHGKPFPMHCLIASFSPVAVDAIAFTLLGGNPMVLEAIQSLAKRNSWSASLNDLTIIGDDWQELIQHPKIPSKDNLETSQTADSLMDKFFYFLTNLTQHKIKIDYKKCTMCLVCLKNCPMNAIKENLSKNRIEINSKRCIACFCCGEGCESDAIYI